MTHASLFSGIGGPEVAATMLGWENLFHCEINEFGRKILDYWYPKSKSYEDITKTDFSEWRGKVDVLTGGFPCQPFSYAGKRRGEDDDRYLWPFMFKAIDQIRPTWVVAENVAGITTMVEQGEVFEMGGQASLFEEVDGLHRYRLAETFTLQRICDDLEGHGYSVQPVLVPACAVGAPHRRDRVFIVARSVVTDSNCGYDGGDDGGDAGENESESGEERLQERHEIREFSQPNQIRRESERNVAADTDNTRDRTSDRESGRVRKEVDEKRENITLYGTCRQSVGNAATDTFVGGAGAPGESGCSERERRRDDVEQEERGESSEWSYGFYELLRNPSDSESEQSGRCELGQPRCRKPKQGEFRGGCGEDVAERHAADTNSRRVQRLNADRELRGKRKDEEPVKSDGGNSEEEHTSYIYRQRLSTRMREGFRQIQSGNRLETLDGKAGCGRWDSFPSVSPVHRGNDGIPFYVDSLSIPFSKWRTESLKAYGNAIVPQVMYEIFRAIELVEK